MRPRRVTSHNGRVSGHLFGRVEADAAPLLVLIHGGGCNSRYFDLPGFSVLRAARDQNLHVLLVDRPGHGLSPAGEGAPIEAAAREIAQLTREIARGRPLFLIGHSIGGAVALTMAAADPGPRIAALAVSGIGDRPAPPVRDWYEAACRSGTVPEPRAQLFFGPQGSYDWRGPAALRKSAEPWQLGELEDTILAWPRRCPVLLGRIEAPVHVRLAEFEQIWEAGPYALARIRGLLGRSPAVDAAILPGGGHLYEVHRRAPELIASQLEFLMEFGAGSFG